MNFNENFSAKNSIKSDENKEQDDRVSFGNDNQFKRVNTLESNLLRVDMRYFG